MTEQASTMLAGALLTLLVTVVLVLALRPIALEIGLADEPGGRKKHAERVPVVGGVAMMLGIAFGAALIVLPDVWLPMLLGAWLLVVVGVVDDRFDLPPSVRLLAQAVAAMVAVFAAGTVVQSLGEPLFFPLSLGFLGPPFTLLLIMTVVNGFNLIDGIDGLAGGVALVSLAALGLLAASTEMLGAIGLLATAVAGFLAFNLPLRRTRPVRVFMGDAGSTALGFLIACICIALSQGPGAAFAPVTGLWLVAVPLYELLAAVWRRVRDGESPWAPDDRHLHHALLARGISPRRTLVFMLLLGAGLAGVGLVGHWIGAPEALSLAGWIAGAVCYAHVTRRPKPVAAWVGSWKEGAPLDPTFVEAAGRERG